MPDAALYRLAGADGLRILEHVAPPEPGALLTFVLSIADSGTPAIVGGKVRVLATTAYNLFTSEMTGYPGLASATSVVLIALSTVVVVVYTSFRKTSGPVFQPGYGLDSYARILREVPHVISNSATYSLIAVVLIVILGTLIGYIVAWSEKRVAGLLDSALFIPYIVPGVVLGLAFVITFNVKPIEITGTATIVVLMLFIRRLPYAVRSSAAILKQIRGSIEEEAISLGASPGRAFLKSTLPLMLPGIVAGALMSLITAINELSSSLILYVGRTMTMPVRIYLSVLDGEFGTAAALSTILLVASGVAVYAVFWVSGRNESAFV